jgi:hypothetical protein
MRLVASIFYSFNPHNGPSRAKRGKRYWQPGNGSVAISMVEPLSGLYL